jgi:hypothetical protein
MILNRDNISTLSNDKTIKTLEDFLKSLFDTDKAIEF